MVALQASIGALNDVVDASADATAARRDKPIPAGLVSHRAGAVVASAFLVAGLGVAVALGPVPFILALAGVATGDAYSLWLKGTRASFVPFAIGIPLLPLFAWAAAAGMLPPSAGAVLTAGALAGVGLSLENGLADIELDRAAGIPTLAVRLGPTPARWIASIVLVLAIGIAACSILVTGAPGATGWLASIGGAMVVAGIALLWRRTGRAQLPWEVTAVGTGVLGVGWLAALVGGAA
jgi:4-hydroxybenzoate polyprenyltransferase